MQTGDTALRSLTDRILRLKAEQDDIGAMVREVYVEVKAAGFDKAVVGRLVTYLRKREKDAAAVEEGDATFDLYLTSYDNGSSRTRTRTREEAIDSETGEIIESRAKATKGKAEGQPDAQEPASDGVASRLSAGRTADATEVAGRDSPERRAPNSDIAAASPSAAPHSAGAPGGDDGAPLISNPEAEDAEHQRSCEACDESGDGTGADPERGGETAGSRPDAFDSGMGGTSEEAADADDGAGHAGGVEPFDGDKHLPAFLRREHAQRVA